MAADRPVARKNNTQLILTVVAGLVLGAVFLVGFLLNRQNTETKNDGYGSARLTVATVDQGVVTVAKGTPAVTIDVYEDPLCPICGIFETQYGQQIAQAQDEGKMAVRYHFLNFLDPASASKNYSTRAAAAVLCAGEHLGAATGVVAAFHAGLFSADVQPSEGGTSDLTDAQLVERLTAAATGAGVPASSPDLAAAASCVTAGAQLETVGASYQTSKVDLTRLTGAVRSPVVVHNGAVVNIDNGDWLTDLTGG